MAQQLFLYLISALICTNFPVTEAKSKLIVLVVDGLQWDRFGLDLPNLDKVEQNGVRVDWMNNVFVTLTLPNLYSIATGLYPESHGVVHNFAWSVEAKTQFTNLYEDTLNLTDWFDTGAEPIWVTAKLAGLKVGNIMYPGAQRPVKGILPEIVVPNTPYYIKHYPMMERVDDTISWLKNRDFDLVLTWFDEPDLTLHTHGVGHPKSIARTFDADNAVGYLFNQLDVHGLSDHTNVIVLSDHGHINIDSRKTIAVYDYVNEADVDFVIQYGPMVQMIAVKGKEQMVYEALKDAHPALTAYKKEDFPTRLHYANNKRVLPIIGLADAGWLLTLRYDPNNDTIVRGSDHGFDNKLMDMKSSFYAQGPFFKKGYRSKPIESVDIYNLMCEILNLEAAPNNGSRYRYQAMIAPNTFSISSTLILSVVVVCILLFVCVFIILRKTDVKEHNV